MTLVRALVFGTVVAITATAAAQEKKAAKKAEAAKAATFDATKLVGTWKISSGSKAGEKVSDDAAKGSLIIDKDTMTLKGDDGMTFLIGYKIDTKANPVAIDLDIRKPEELKSQAKGIIQISEETVTLCYHPMGGDRPKKFEATKDNGLHMFTLKKAGANSGTSKEPKKASK